MKHNRIARWFSTLLTLICVTGHGAVTFSDGLFSNSDWTSTVFTTGAGATASATQLASGGNPGACRHIIHDVPSGASIFVLHLRTNAIYTPSVQGAIASIDYGEDAIMFIQNLNGMRTGPALRQGTNVFVCDVLRTPETGWTSKIVTNLAAAHFALVSPGFPAFTNSSVHPDFSESAPPIQFGFFRGNSNSGTRDGGIDNWTVTVRSVPPTLLNVRTYAGFELRGSVGQGYRVDYTLALPPTNWTTLTNIVLPSSPYLIIDTTAPATAHRFYRAVETP